MSTKCLDLLLKDDRHFFCCLLTFFTVNEIGYDSMPLLLHLNLSRDIWSKLIANVLRTCGTSVGFKRNANEFVSKFETLFCDRLFYLLLSLKKIKSRFISQILKSKKKKNVLKHNALLQTKVTYNEFQLVAKFFNDKKPSPSTIKQQIIICSCFIFHMTWIFLTFFSSSSSSSSFVVDLNFFRRWVRNHFIKNMKVWFIIAFHNV